MLPKYLAPACLHSSPGSLAVEGDEQCSEEVSWESDSDTCLEELLRITQIGTFGALRTEPGVVSLLQRAQHGSMRTPGSTALCGALELAGSV